jgi:hypothetical protein
LRSENIEGTKEERGLKRKDNTWKVVAGLGKFVFFEDYLEVCSACDSLSGFLARLIHHSAFSFARIMHDDGWIRDEKLCCDRLR